MNTAEPGKAERQFTGWHALIMICSFFGIIIAVNVYFAVEAERSWTGVVVEDSYTSGQGFNQKVQLVREQDALGWQEKLAYAAGVLRLDVLGGNGQPLPMQGLSVALSRPIGDDQDQTVALSRAADGSYIAPVTLGKGKWNAVITATGTPHGAYERHEQIELP